MKADLLLGVALCCIVSPVIHFVFYVSGNLTFCNMPVVSSHGRQRQERTLYGQGREGFRVRGVGLSHCSHLLLTGALHQCQHQHVVIEWTVCYHLEEWINAIKPPFIIIILTWYHVMWYRHNHHCCLAKFSVQISISNVWNLLLTAFSSLSKLEQSHNGHLQSWQTQDSAKL